MTPTIVNCAPTSPATTPMTPPNTDSSTASMMNWLTMSPAGADRLADADLAGPLGDGTSMMFMTPIPPTSSEIAATAPSSTVNVRLLEVAASRNDDALDTV